MQEIENIVLDPPKDDEEPAWHALNTVIRKWVVLSQWEKDLREYNYLQESVKYNDYSYEK